MKQVAARTLKVLILDEADLMFSYGYEEDASSRDSVIIPFHLRGRQFAKVKALCALMPPKYQVRSLVCLSAPKARLVLAGDAGLCDFVRGS